MNCDDQLYYQMQDSQAYEEKMSGLIHELIAALVSVKRGKCWCVAGKHDRACLDIQDLLKRMEEVI